MPGTEKQARFFRVVRAVQKGEMARDEASASADKAADTMSVRAVRDFARSTRTDSSRLKGRSRK